jgi:phenylalanyl-tRNA synthetase beta subunit
MKILYSELKVYIPGLKTSPKAVMEALSLTGILVDSFAEVSVAGKKDYVIGLEVRQNRPDCLGVQGVAREVAAYFGLPFVLPRFKFPAQKHKLQVSVKANNDVKRVSVLEIEGLDNSKATPAWLLETLAAHGMNSMSLIMQ